MEIRANYILVGCFALASLLGILLFTWWVAKDDGDIATSIYDISFNESVAGLSVNNDVLFSGIRVGTVTQIKISETEPGAVRVRIAIAADTPVRANSEAKLEVRGLTGVSVIAVSGGTKESPLNRPAPNKIGTILYRASPFASVLERFPDTISAANETLSRLNAMLSDENQQAFSVAIQSFSALSTTLASRAQSLDSILAHSESTIKHVDSMAAAADSFLNTELKSGGANVASAVRRFDDMLRTMEPGLKQFSKEGLTDMRMLMVEARNLMHVLTRIGQKLESDPRRFFLGDSVQEYRPR